MIQAKIVSNIKFPKIALGKDLEHIARGIIIPDIIKGIDNQMAISGGRLPKNEPATIKRKGSSKSLFETGKLRSSFYYKMVGLNKVLIGIKGDRKKIGGYLQIEGIKTKAMVKFYNFFGISMDAHKRAMKYMEDRIKRLISGS